MNVKPFCAPGVVYGGAIAVHDAYMRKKAKKTAAKTEKVISRLRPKYQITFIKPWRLRRKLSQQALADKVGAYLEERGIREEGEGYTHASIQRLENGIVPYKQPVMEAIADALGVTVETLIARPPPKDPDKPDDPDTELSGIWKRTDDDQRVRFVEILKTITRKTGTGG